MTNRIAIVLLLAACASCAGRSPGPALDRIEAALRQDIADRCRLILATNQGEGFTTVQECERLDEAETFRPTFEAIAKAKGIQTPPASAAVRGGER